MTLDELRAVVAASAAEDWYELTPGPVHIYSFGDGSENGEWRIFLDSHHSRAVLKSDLDVGIAWGLDCEDTFSEAWTQNFPNTSAKSHYADILWRGVPVIREQYIGADGGRYQIPLPDTNSEELTPTSYVSMGFTITPWQYAVMNIVGGLSGGYDLDEGLRRARIEVAR